MKVSAMADTSDNAQKVRKQPVTEGLSPPRRARILVVDDDENICYFVSIMLKHGGYSVATALGGKKAIALYRQALAAGKPFDAVILDLTIPDDIGGVEALKKLLAIDPFVKAIISSGYADDPVMVNAADYGFKGIITKPFIAKTLWDVVKEVLK